MPLPTFRATFVSTLALVTVSLNGPAPALAEQLILDDLVVVGEACIGAECATGETFATETMKLKDVSPRLLFESTSPSSLNDGDWAIQTGLTLQNFNILDVSSSTNPFRIEGAAPTDAFVMDANGNVGLGLSFPDTDLHIRSADTPTIRLDQSSASANFSTVWDLGGNEANFFIRELGDPETLPFRIRPGAPSNALYVAGNGEIGMGIPDPRGALHIRRNQPNNVPHLILQTRRTDGRAEIWFEDDNTSTDNDALRLQLNGDVFNVSFNGTGGAELAITKTGDVRVPRGDLIVSTGGVIVGGQALNVPDYVFAPDYDLMPLADVAAFIAAHSHLPELASAAEVQAEGLDMVEMQLALLKKVEELTLYTLAQDARARAQADEIAALRNALAHLTGGE